MRLAVEHNLTVPELVTTLTGMAVAADATDALLRSLSATREPREPVRERYLTELMQEFAQAGRALDAQLADNVERLLLGAATPSVIAKALYRVRPLLGQVDVDELIRLIRAHFRVAIRLGGRLTWDERRRLQTRWRRMGIIQPTVDLGALLDDALVAGRLAEILTDTTSLAEMRRLAAERPLGRAMQLAQQATRERVGLDLAGGPGYRAEVLAGELVVPENARRVQAILAAARAGTLTYTPTNRAGLSPEEVALLGVKGSSVEGWRAIARELRNRLARDDRTRDWERVAASSTRMTANIGMVLEMAERGVAELYYDVHVEACPHCKQVYLLPDGSPRIFTVGEILANITATGGANYGRKASLIGDAEKGWIPNALLHPWCQCRPRQVIPGITPRSRTYQGAR